MFARPHHQRIHEVLLALDAALLREHECYFGGGTAIVLLRDEYRESVDMDFMVSDLTRYRALRRVLQDRDALARFFGLGRGPLAALPEVRADQYGIRAALPLKTGSIKFEIVFEARITFDSPGPEDQIVGIASLTQVDLVASKLLANVDRWADDGVMSPDILDLAMLQPTPKTLADDGVMSRDILDLAMLQPTSKTWSAAVRKAEDAYGAVVLQSLEKARARLLDDPQRLARCIEVLQVSTPQALLYQRLKALP